MERERQRRKRRASETVETATEHRPWLAVSRRSESARDGSWGDGVVLLARSLALLAAAWRYSWLRAKPEHVYAFVRAFRVRRQVKSARVFETRVARGRGLETDIHTRIVSSEPALRTYLVGNRVRDALVIKYPPSLPPPPIRLRELHTRSWLAATVCDLDRCISVGRVTKISAKNVGSSPSGLESSRRASSRQLW